MYSELLQHSDLQPFLNQPETLINQTLEFQLAVANYLQTPRQLLEILVNNSPYPQVVEAAKLHVNLAGDIGKNWREVAEVAIKNAPLQQNDRLVAELLKIAPVPEYLISEWIPGHRLIEGLVNPYLPKEDKVKLLERLGKSTIIEERLKAAAHQDTPKEILEILAGDLELPIRIAVKYRDDDFDDAIAIIKSQHEIASNWDTNPQQLVELAGSKWSWIRQAVARNFYTPAEVLGKLAGDGEEKIQLAVARNLATPGEVLDLLVNHGFGEVTESIAKHPNASEDALIKLLPRYEYNIQRRVNLTPNILEAFAEYDNTRFNQVLLDNFNTSGTTLEKLVIPPCDLCLIERLARHPNVLVSTLEKLSQHYSPLIRVDVYKNSNTPNSLRNQIREELSKCHELLDNFNKKEAQRLLGYKELTIDDIHKKLLKDNNTPITDYEIACHPKTPSHILEKLAGTNYESGVAKNPNTQSHVLRKLIHSSSSYTRKCVAQNPSTPQDILIELMNQTNFQLDNYPFRTYADWIHLAYEYLNFPKKELYSVLLDKEISEENQKARGFILESCDNIKQFNKYTFINKDTEAPHYQGMMPDKPSYYYRLPVKLSPTLKGITRLYKPEDDLPTLLSEYLQSQVPFVRFISLMHPLIPIEFLQQYSQSLLWWERYALAINFSTPFEVRKRLTKDCNCIVKAAAQDNL